MIASSRTRGRCANRLLVQDGIYDAFAERLAKTVAELRVGDGREPGTDQGPLIVPTLRAGW